MATYELVVNDDHAAAADTRSDLAISIPADGAAPAAAKAEQRLASLDVFRGITVALMIIVDNAGAVLPAISHSPWDGATLADFVMPFFLFIVGIALALAYKRVPKRSEATKKAVLRALKLFLFGIFLQGGYFHGVHNLNYGVDISSIRVMGILQRIAIGYFVAAMCEIWLRSEGVVDSGPALLKRYRYQLLVGLLLTTLYTILLYGLYVPDWEYQISGPDAATESFYVKCGVRGSTGPACNAAGMIDRKILGLQHLYRRPVYLRTKQCSVNSPQNGPLPSDAPSWCQAPFDPEGILSSLMAIVTCLIGLQFGRCIIHFQKHEDRIRSWLTPSLVMLAAGIVLHICGIRINKALYTLSYTLVTAGAAGLLFLAIYILVDKYQFRRPLFAMEWMGKHALMIFILVACNIVPIIIHGFYWKDPKNNLLGVIGVGR